MPEADITNPILTGATKLGARVCLKCNIEKELDDFNKSTTRSDGRHSWCRKCFNAYAKERRIKGLEKSKPYIGSEAQKAYARKSMAAHRAKDPDAARKKRREDRFRDPTKFRRIEKERRDRKKAGGGRVTEKQWCDLKDIYGHKCYYCGKKEPLTQDHYLALSREGRHHIDNIVPACGPCNSKKTYLTSEEYYWRMCGGKREGHSKSTSYRNLKEGRAFISCK